MSHSQSSAAAAIGGRMTEASCGVFSDFLDIL